MITDYTSFKEALFKATNTEDYKTRLHYNAVLQDFRGESPADYEKYMQRLRRDYRRQQNK